MSEIETLRCRVAELEAEVAEQTALIKDKADAGHTSAKYWSLLVQERRRVVQLRGDIVSWQEMHRVAAQRLRAALTAGPVVSDGECRHCNDEGCAACSFAHLDSFRSGPAADEVQP